MYKLYHHIRINNTIGCICTVNYSHVCPLCPIQSSVHLRFNCGHAPAIRTAWIVMTCLIQYRDKCTTMHKAVWCFRFESHHGFCSDCEHQTFVSCFHLFFFYFFSFITGGICLKALGQYLTWVWRTSTWFFYFFNIVMYSVDYCSFNLLNGRVPWQGDVTTWCEPQTWNILPHEIHM